MPVGRHHEDALSKNFRTQEFELQKGDAVYMFSDGYADQFGGPDGKKFLRGKLKELILLLQDKSMGEQKKLLSENLENWKKGGKEVSHQTDDVTVMGIKI